MSKDLDLNKISELIFAWSKNAKMAISHISRSNVIINYRHDYLGNNSYMNSFKNNYNNFSKTEKEAFLIILKNTYLELEDALNQQELRFKEKNE